MELLDAVCIIEDVGESHDSYLEAWQFLIDEGHAWKLQGFYGRVAMELMRERICLPAPVRHTDYWGNIVPSRNDGYFDINGDWVWSQKLEQ